MSERFDNLSLGDFFKFDDSIFIKTFTYAGSYNSLRQCFGGVCLKGKHHGCGFIDFDGNQIVEIIELDFIEKEVRNDI